MRSARTRGDGTGCVAVPMTSSSPSLSSRTKSSFAAVAVPRATMAGGDDRWEIGVILCDRNTAIASGYRGARVGK